MVAGLVDLVNIFSYNLVDDEAGGLTQSSKVLLYTRVWARISVMTSEMQQTQFGFAGKELWRVLVEYSPCITNIGKFYLQLHSDSTPSVISSGGIYRIISSRHQRTEHNVWHHTSLVIEHDEQAEE